MSVEALSSSSRVFNTYFVFGCLFPGQPDTNYFLLSMNVNLHSAPHNSNKNFAFGAPFLQAAPTPILAFCAPTGLTIGLKLKSH